MSDLPKDALTPAKIVERQLRFRIPLYQRPYAWEDAQVRQLLDDIIVSFTENVSADYHIGILSVADASDNEYDLIDGQQRITTLALIGKAAKKNWFTDRLELYGRPDDKAYLTGTATVSCNPNPRMMQTVHIAEDYLNRYPGLEDFIYNHAAFFLSEVPAEYTLLDKNQQFVRFNNRGRQLEKHEILKVQIISVVEDVDWRKEAFDVWEKMTTLILGVTASSFACDVIKNLGQICKESETKEQKESEEILYRAMVGVEEFLLIALARTVRTAVTECGPKFYNKSRLLETFRTYIKEDIARKRFIEVLQKQVVYLRKYFIFIGKGDETYVVGIAANDKDTNWLGDEMGAEGSKSGERQLVDVQSFLYVSTPPQKWLIPAFDWIDKEQGCVSAGAFIVELERIDRELCKRLPALEEMRFGNINHYWFYRLDYELLKLWRGDDKLWAFVKSDCTLKNWPGLKEFRFRHCGSVEHIVPQQQMESNATADHAFRNLALISASRNSRFSNEVRAGKQQYILQSRYTESLKMLHALWSGQTPDQHGTIMYNILANAVNYATPTEPQP